MQVRGWQAAGNSSQWEAAPGTRDLTAAERQLCADTKHAAACTVPSMEAVHACWPQSEAHRGPSRLPDCTLTVVLAELA